MPQPVKLSDELINAARTAAEGAHRSLAAQVEHWAALGRAVDGSMTADQSAALKTAVREPAASPYGSATDVTRLALDRLMAATTPAFRASARQRLAGDTQPLYGEDPAFPGLIVRQDADGTRTPGRFHGSDFVPAATARKPPARASGMRQRTAPIPKSPPARKRRA